MAPAKLALGTLLTTAVMATGLSAGASPAAARTAAQPPVSARLTGLPLFKGSVKIKGQAQKTGYYCAPASSSIVLRMFGVKRSQDQLAKEMKTDPKAGATKRQNTLSVLNRHLKPKGYTFRLTYARNRPAALMLRVSHAVGVLKKPTILAVLGNKLPWSKASRTYGHAIVAYGYDRAKGTITVWDPNVAKGALGSHVISAKALAAVVNDRPDSGLGGVYTLSKPLLPR
ncbi:C39 family peptidase [Nonomuraea mesophila]|uniref:C39 family peptidase n=1 Tax=Nonomuraea mesophila TaxID=2530382 RepID=UPI00140CCFD4|nr:C39 family peptidase [Nonomuraea mesophila]